MNFNNIIDKASSESGYSDAENCTRIYISASADVPVLGDISNAFAAQTGNQNIASEIVLAGSSGYYDLEPIVRIDKPDRPAVIFRNVTPEAAETIVDEYLVNDRPVGDITLGSTGSGRIDGMPDIIDMPLFSLQNRVALRNCGLTDPGNIGSYILNYRGYSGLDAALGMSPAEVISEVRKSGLRGKGGAGYPAADKWQVCSEAGSEHRYLLCNAVDADPDSRAAELLLESDPHSVLEGMLIAAYAVGASECYICISSRNIRAIGNVEKALEQMKEYDLTGESILGSAFNCEITVHEVADSLVSGEETSLIRSIEGKQPIPYLRTVYPAEAGINNMPTLVNNAETLACVSAIFQNDAEWYSGVGTEQSPGTKIITISGNAAHRYTIEVPFGTTLKNVVMDIGGGATDKKAIRAVRFGGPLGGFFDAASLETGIDFESMEEAGSIIGSGVVKVYDESVCVVETVRDLVDYMQNQSCGKCVFCREGSLQIFEILKDISENNSKQGDLELVAEICEAMKEGSICDLGTYLPNPVLSSIGLFGGDYEIHIKNRKCPADRAVK